MKSMFAVMSVGLFVGGNRCVWVRERFKLLCDFDACPGC
jgi:hypothetical protein